VQKRAQLVFRELPARYKGKFSVRFKGRSRGCDERVWGGITSGWDRTALSTPGQEVQRALDEREKSNPAGESGMAECSADAWRRKTGTGTTNILSLPGPLW